ncbi:MAG TPA: M3 family oligoendopeptidase, partial [Longilinea sp.]|nr:M3 family oligoendopeptidase [Longilinea sp.]
QQLAKANAKTPPEQLAKLLDECVDLFNEALLLSNTLNVYISSFVTTDSYNTLATKKMSEYELVWVGLQQTLVKFQGWVGSLGDALSKALKYDGSAKAHTFFLKEAAEQSKYLMSQPEEMLAAELSLSGANAWSKLQGTVTSQITVDFELDGKVQKLPMPALINLHGHSDESVRHRAYDVEMKEWEKVREPLAACMNGIKGTANTLNHKRGRTDCLHAPIDQARIDRQTLEALLAAMNDSFPMFRRYFKAKAKRFGKEKLAWWDVFAPTGKIDTVFTFARTREFILENFNQFSPDLHDFAKRAFDHNWIDAEQRDGKRGGAFCAPVPKQKESRVLCNFDGTLDQVSTIAHELGHGFHNDCAFRFGKTELQQATPMTLAETASIMCETIVSNAVLKQARDSQEELAILENALINDSQVIVDIYSRYLFEKEVMERREKSELSADDLCDIMDRAQAATYGDGLDERYRHNYMWTWKPHYYFADLNFYNFPYAFGLLFGTGLYAIYQQRGPSFVPDYENLLASTGEGNAAELAARFGIDIRTRNFWDDSLKIIAKRVERYCEI